MEEKNALRPTYALVGKAISYSFSSAFFTQKFTAENIDAQYINFDIPSLDALPSLIAQYPALKGMNVTIPYKEAIFSHLDEVDTLASRIGAVNTIKIYPNGKRKGFNTDYVGFFKTIAPFLTNDVKKALVLGTGGASKAIAAALSDSGVAVTFVSQRASENALSYAEVTPQCIKDHLLVVNCTPLGSAHYPDALPPLAYDAFTQNHILYDLIYNPAVTPFLSKGEEKGAKTLNGYQMLVEQALAAWAIWCDLSK